MAKVEPALPFDHFSGKLSSKELIYAAVRMLKQKGYLQPEDNVAYLSGLVRQGGTTLLEISKVNSIINNSYSFHVPQE